MHLGNVYACLAAWLAVRSQGRRGRVILRIEDIDGPRVVKDADRWIMDDLAWLGLDWDGPVAYQSRRGAVYRHALEVLKGQTLGGRMLDDHAWPDTPEGDQPLVYPCFCSRADIRAASAPNEGDGFTIYPGTCRGLPYDLVRFRLESGDRHSLRIAVPVDSGDSGAVCRFHDLVFGDRVYTLPRDLGDVVIQRSDGLMSYQLAVTVDDLDMGVNQVVRGRDLLRSTAIQSWIRERLDRDAGPVQYAHLPLIDGADGRRMSKRYGSLDLGTLRARGWSPERVIGICACLLGLLPHPEPVAAADLVDGFTWKALSRNLADRRLDEAGLEMD